MRSVAADSATAGVARVGEARRVLYVTCVVSQVVVLKLPVDRRVGPPSAGWTAGAGTSLVYPKLGYSVSDRVSVDCLPAGVVLGIASGKNCLS